MEKSELIEMQKKKKNCGAMGIYANPAAGIKFFNKGIGNDNNNPSTYEAQQAAAGENASSADVGASGEGGVGLGESKKFSGGHSKEKFRPDMNTRYVRRYFIRPQNIFCSNKEDVLNALIEFEDQDMTIYTMNNLPDGNKDTTKLTDDDVIYFYEDGILMDKNGVKILPLIKIRDEENRDEVDIKTASDKTLKQVYADRVTGLSEEQNRVPSHEFDLDFDSFNAYGEKLVEGKVVDGICCICGEKFEGEGNEASPYKTGKCCNFCYDKFVAPMESDEE